MKNQVPCSFYTHQPALYLALLFAISIAFAGCNDGGGPGGTANPSGTADEVVIKGSNTIGEELAPKLVQEFKKQNDKAKFSIETKGSASGFWGVIAGVCDIAASSRSPLKDELQQAEVRGIQLQDNQIGFYRVGVVLHSTSPVTNLTKQQVRDIFTGSIQNWKEVGGPDTAIHCYIRDPISGTYLGFRELALEDKAYGTNAVTELKSYSAIAEAVAKDPAGIGYASLGEASKAGVKFSAIEGVPHDAASVKESKYPFARPLHLFTNKAKESSSAQAFIDFVQSAKGQQILAEMGYVPK